MPEPLTLVVSTIGGVLPALLWLWFWLREDSAHPEPRRLIIYAFLAGMATVGIVVPIELYVRSLVGENENLIYALWSSIEETFKFVAAAAVVLWRREDDEPIDAVIYMVVVALGFAAAENTLFLLSPISGSNTAETLLSGNFRFIGATLLHTLSSSVIGLSLAVSFYRSRLTHYSAAFAGILVACAVHASFNYLILHVEDEHLLRVFTGVWIGIIALLAMLEYVKRIRPRRLV